MRTYWLYHIVTPRARSACASISAALANPAPLKHRGCVRLRHHGAHRPQSPGPQGAPALPTAARIQSTRRHQFCSQVAQAVRVSSDLSPPRRLRGFGVAATISAELAPAGSPSSSPSHSQHCAPAGSPASRAPGSASPPALAAPCAAPPSKSSKCSEAPENLRRGSPLFSVLGIPTRPSACGASSSTPESTAHLSAVSSGSAPEVIGRTTPPSPSRKTGAARPEPSIGRAADKPRNSPEASASPNRAEAPAAALESQVSTSVGAPRCAPRSPLA